MLEWDEAKAISNVEKHGVSFEDAATCFEDLRVLMFHDVPHSGAEDSQGGAALSIPFDEIRKEVPGEVA